MTWMSPFWAKRYPAGITDIHGKLIAETGFKKPVDFAGLRGRPRRPIQKKLSVGLLPPVSWNRNGMNLFRQSDVAAKMHAAGLATVQPQTVSKAESIRHGLPELAETLPLLAFKSAVKLRSATFLRRVRRMRVLRAI